MELDFGGTEDKVAAGAQTHPKLKVPEEAVIEEMVSGTCTGGQSYLNGGNGRRSLPGIADGGFAGGGASTSHPGGGGGYFSGRIESKEHEVTVAGGGGSYNKDKNRKNLAIEYLDRGASRRSLHFIKNLNCIIIQSSRTSKKCNVINLVQYNVTIVLFVI